MAFTKIQPQQVQLPTFLSHNGHLTFSDLTTGVEVVLSPDITGNFNIDGTLTISNNEPITSNSTNSSDTNGKTFGGQDNTATGLNVVVNGRSIDANSGSFNTALNGRDSHFGKNGQYNTIVGGKNASFADETTGSMIIADQKSASQIVDTNHSLLISFNSGTTFADGDVEFDSHLKVNANHSGILSGNVHIGGDLDVTGDSVFAGSVEIDDILVLQDGADAASQVWVDERVGFSFTESIDNTLTTTLEGGSYPYVSSTNLENVLTGTAVGSDVFTGHVLTGYVGSNEHAYFVLQGANFTGAMLFNAGSFRAV